MGRPHRWDIWAKVKRWVCMVEVLMDKWIEIESSIGYRLWMGQQFKIKGKKWNEGMSLLRVGR